MCPGAGRHPPQAQYKRAVLVHLETPVCEHLFARRWQVHASIPLMHQAPYTSMPSTNMTPPPPTPFTIDMTGTAEAFHPAERAKLKVLVSSTGTNKSSVSDEVITTSNHIEKMLREYSAKESTPEAKLAAPLAHWSKSGISFNSYWTHKYRKDEEALKVQEHKVQVTFDIRFRDFNKMGDFASVASKLPHVEMHHVEWLLTSATEKSFRSKLRIEASQDALSKASDYCRALGCTAIRAVSLSEGGMALTVKTSQGVVSQSKLDVPFGAFTSEHRSPRFYGDLHSAAQRTNSQTASTSDTAVPASQVKLQ